MEKFPTAVYKRVSQNNDNAEVYITYNVGRDQWVFTDRYWDETDAVIYAHATDIGPTCPNDMRLWFMEDVPITVEIRFLPCEFSFTHLMANLTNFRRSHNFK